jgi:hypothetical protein
VVKAGCAAAPKPKGKTSCVVACHVHHTESTEHESGAACSVPGHKALSLCPSFASLWCSLTYFCQNGRLINREEKILTAWWQCFEGMSAWPTIQLDSLGSIESEGSFRGLGRFGFVSFGPRIHWESQTMATKHGYNQGLICTRGSAHWWCRRALRRNRGVWDAHSAPVCVGRARGEQRLQPVRSAFKFPVF